MALNKSIDLDNGFSVSYHRIISVDFNLISTDSKISVASYKDAQARTDGKNPVYYKNYSVPSSPVFLFNAAALDSSSPIAIGYDYIKSLDEFSGALDV